MSARILAPADNLDLKPAVLHVDAGRIGIFQRGLVVTTIPRS
jgi:hypothetical protein